MEEPEMMSQEEARRFADLSNKICMAIEEDTECTYQDVIRVLDVVRKNYERKGKDLLNKTNIQEVAKFGTLLV